MGAIKEHWESVALELFGEVSEKSLDLSRDEAQRRLDPCVSCEFMECWNCEHDQIRRKLKIQQEAQV